jgi:hypothetical protein
MFNSPYRASACFAVSSVAFVLMINLDGPFRPPHADCTYRQKSPFSKLSPVKTTKRAGLSARLLTRNEKQREFPAPPWAGVKRVSFLPRSAVVLGRNPPLTTSQNTERLRQVVSGRVKRPTSTDTPGVRVSLVPRDRVEARRELKSRTLYRLFWTRRASANAAGHRARGTLQGRATDRDP